jgi:hypothetical protein
VTHEHPVPGFPAFDISDVATIQSFAGPSGLTARIAGLEARMAGISGTDIASVLGRDGVDEPALTAAVAVKRVAGQINVIVHAIGMLTALPYILEPDEIVEEVSLGAGNTGRAHDLVTNRQIAEFKFIEWQGGPESIRQNGLFIDLFSLASASTEKRRVLYVVGKAFPMRFLNNNRALSSVLSKNTAVAERFRQLHGNQFLTVKEYYATVAPMVAIVDLIDVVPVWRRLVSA